MGIRHLLRREEGLGKRHLVLSDNMGWVLYAAKGRPHVDVTRGTAVLLCRQAGALALFSGFFRVPVDRV